MIPAKKLASYQSVAVATASPGKLVLMLFDGALRFLRAAEEGFQIASLRQRQETVHNNLMKAQSILTELQRCLNLRDGGDFSINLFRLYDFMNGRIMDANVRKDPEPIRVVTRLLGEVRDAWDQMLREQHAAENASVSLSLSA